jgi:NAD(P)-dependent dehydrogenase (short-subunit alcohol dehydrogenase family)
MTDNTKKTALVVGASRTLGLGLAAEYLRHGWNIIGTVSGARRTELHHLAESSAGRLVVESLDMTTRPPKRPAQTDTGRIWKQRWPIAIRRCR